MATSGSTSVKVTDYDTLKFSWSISSQSTTNNTSTVNWKLQLIATNYGYISSSVSNDWSVTVNGTKYSGTNYVEIANNTTKTLASGTTTISHNSDGTKTFSYSFSQEFAITFSGTYIGTKSGSGSGTLTTIPRGSVLGTISAFTIGNAINIPITKYSSSFTDILTISVGGTTVKTVSSITNGYDVSFTSSELSTIFSKLSGKTNGTFTFKLTTKSGSTTIGTSSKTATGTIPTGALGTISNFTLGNSITIPISKYYSSLTYNLTISLSSTTIKTVSGVANGDTVTFSTSELSTIYNKLPSATTGTFTFKLTTKSGSATVGISSKTATGTIPTSVKPTISSITLSEGNSDIVPSSWGVYVEKKSKLKVVVSSSGAYGSTIKSYKITGIDSSTYTSANFTSSVLQTSGTRTVTVTVTDSRGRTATKTTTYTCIAYSDPLISTATVTRCNSDGTTNSEGSYVKYTFKATVSAVSNKNTYGYKLGYKKTSESSYTYITISNSAYTLDKSNVIISGVEFSVDNSYNFQFVVTDYFSTVNKIQNIETGYTLMNYNASGKGFALGKVSEKDWFEVSMPMEINDYVIENKKDFSIPINTGQKTGWYLAFSGTMTGYESRAILLAISQVYNGNSGILYINLRCNNSTTLVKSSFHWVTFTGLDSAGVNLVLNGNNFYLYLKTFDNYQQYQIRILHEKLLGGRKYNSFKINTPTYNDTVDEPNGEKPRSFGQVSGSTIYLGTPSSISGVTTYLRGNTVRIYSHTSGAVYLGSSGSTAITSDENLKDISEIDNKYIEFFNNLKPVTYVYKKNGHRNHVGFGARQVEESLIKAGLTTEQFAGVLKDTDVTISADEMETEEDVYFDELYSLRYEEFIALNTLMIQKQSKEIENLKSRLETLEKKLKG